MNLQEALARLEWIATDVSFKAPEQQPLEILKAHLADLLESLE